MRLTNPFDRIKRSTGKVQVNADGTVSITGTTTFGTPLTNANMNPTYTAFTPTVTQSAAVAITTNIARHCIVGKTVHVYGYVTSTATTGTAGQPIVLVLPAALTSSGSPAVGAFQIVGSGLIYDSSGTTSYNAQPYLTSTTTVQFYHSNSNGAVIGVSPSFGFDTNDIIQFSLQYELA